MNHPTHYVKPFAVRDPFFGSVIDRFFAATDAPTARSTSKSFAPRVDVLESDTAFKLVVDLPGYQKEDVSVELEEGVLTLKAKQSTDRKIDEETGDYKVVRTERTSGVFERRFTLDDSVMEDGIEARLENGVLEVRLPKATEAAAVRRTVTIS